MDALYRYQRKTGNIPDALATRPDPPSPIVDFFLSAFQFLSRFRGSNGFGMNPISYQDIVRFGERIEFTMFTEFSFAEVISEMDQAYLAAMHEKMKAQPK